MKFIIVITFMFMTSLLANDQATFEDALKSYEQLHQSFFDGNLAKVNSNAKALMGKLLQLESSEIKSKLTYAQKKLNELEGAQDLEKAKDAMNIVSQALLIILEKDLPNKNYDRYYCPMVKKYWIQNVSKNDKVYNPYASQSMPHCGERK
jgi:hypothetical protein